MCDINHVQLIEIAYTGEGSVTCIPAIWWHGCWLPCIPTRFIQLHHYQSQSELLAFWVEM